MWMVMRTGMLKTGCATRLLPRCSKPRCFSASAPAFVTTNWRHCFHDSNSMLSKWYVCVHVHKSVCVHIIPFQWPPLCWLWEFNTRLLKRGCAQHKSKYRKHHWLDNERKTTQQNQTPQSNSSSQYLKSVMCMDFVPNHLHWNHIRKGPQTGQYEQKKPSHQAKPVSSVHVPICVLYVCMFCFFLAVHSTLGFEKKKTERTESAVKIQIDFWFDSRFTPFSFRQDHPLCSGKLCLQQQKKRGTCTQSFTWVILLLYITNIWNIYI